MQEIKYSDIRLNHRDSIQLIKIDNQWFACFDWEGDSDTGIEGYRTCLKLASPEVFSLVAEYANGDWTSEKFDKYGGGRPDDESPVAYEIIKKEDI